VPQDKKGFAVVVAISLMAFLMLLSLGITSTLKLANQRSSLRHAQKQAQDNARYSLQWALAQLTEYTGADTRIIAPKDTDDGTLGAWDASDWDFQNPEQKHFIAWLGEAKKEVPNHTGEHIAFSVHKVKAPQGLLTNVHTGGFREELTQAIHSKPSTERIPWETLEETVPLPTWGFLKGFLDLVNNDGPITPHAVLRPLDPSKLIDIEALTEISEYPIGPIITDIRLNMGVNLKERAYENPRLSNVREEIELTLTLYNPYPNRLTQNHYTIRCLMPLEENVDYPKTTLELNSPSTAQTNEREIVSLFKNKILLENNLQTQISQKLYHTETFFLQRKLKNVVIRSRIMEAPTFDEVRTYFPKRDPHFTPKRCILKTHLHPKPKNHYGIKVQLLDQKNQIYQELHIPFLNKISDNEFNFKNFKENIAFNLDCAHTSTLSPLSNSQASFVIPEQGSTPQWDIQELYPGSPRTEPPRQPEFTFFIPERLDSVLSLRHANFIPLSSYPKDILGNSWPDRRIATLTAYTEESSNNTLRNTEKNGEDEFAFELDDFGDGEYHIDESGDLEGPQSIPLYQEAKRYDMSFIFNTAFLDNFFVYNPKYHHKLDEELSPAPEALVINNSFNVNTLAEEEWTALFTSLPEMNESQVSMLAQAMVEQVRLRGPFMSIADFANRRLIDGKQGKCGALQAACKEAGLDIPQAVLLETLLPRLSVREDTFVIRAYGDSCYPETGELKAAAWCEAVVQRMPEGNADRRPYRVVGFRWLDETTTE
tara:strand:- start:264 stop:2564 length:2301 start_codon:yes stop_codon:yes gene_type:complete